MSLYLLPKSGLLLCDVVIRGGKIQRADVVNGLWNLVRDGEHFTARPYGWERPVNRWIPVEEPLYKIPPGKGDYSEVFAWFDALTETEREAYLFTDQELGEDNAPSPKEDDEPPF